MSKRIRILLALAALVAGVGAAGFYSGSLYQQIQRQRQLSAPSALLINFGNSRPAGGPADQVTSTIASSQTNIILVGTVPTSTAPGCAGLAAPTRAYCLGTRWHRVSNWH
jgi:hypothetical protein